MPQEGVDGSTVNTGGADAPLWFVLARGSLTVKTVPANRPSGSPRIRTYQVEFTGRSARSSAVALGEPSVWSVDHQQGSG